MPRPPLAATLTVLLAASLVGCSGWHQVPSEYLTLQRVLQRLAQGNDLGTQPIAFMVGSGTYTAQLAQQRGLCKPDQCEFFAQLNPYQHYGNGWDELMRQGYALGDIQAWSASSGTVMIPRAAFRAYGPHEGYLACTIAHEIAHIRRYHIFEQTHHGSHNLRGLPDKQQQLELMKHSRQQELEADRDAATMLQRAGYPKRVCQEELQFMYRSVGDGSITEPDSTHPGYEERVAAMGSHYDAMAKQRPRPQPSTTLRFRYDPGDNLLTAVPQPH